MHGLPNKISNIAHVFVLNRQKQSFNGSGHPDPLTVLLDDPSGHPREHIDYVV